MRTPSSLSRGLDLAHRWPTGSSSGCPPSIAARYFSSCPVDSISRWTPCPPGTAFPRPARFYPHFWIWHPSFERPRDLNPPEQRAAQRTRQEVKTQNTANGGFESWACLDGHLQGNSS